MAARDATGLLAGWMGTCTDVDELRRLRDEQAVLVAELQRRTRNLLAAVAVVAERTRVASVSPDAF